MLCRMNQPGEDTGVEQEQLQSSSFSIPKNNLDLLPTEVLVAILSAARSTTDLYALVHSSPRLYQIFVAAKREVLLSIVARNLGYGLRDAVAVVLITPTKLQYQEPTYLEECERIIHHYEALPHSHGQRTLLSRLSMDTIIVISRLDRTVQFLVDEFARSRLPELYKSHPDAGKPLTTTERRRLAQAFLRHQILARIEPGNRPRSLSIGEDVPRETALMHRFLTLFRPWEIEQLSQAHSFLHNLVARAFPRQSPTAHTLEPWNEPRTPRDRQRDAAIYDLDMLRNALTTGPTPDCGRLPRSGGSRQTVPVLSTRFRFLRAGPLPMPDDASRRVPRECRALRGVLYRREDTLPRLVAVTAGGGNGDNGDDDHGAPPPPPFGWVDAHGGLDCQRWGHQVRREAPGDGEDHSTGWQRGWVRENVDRWRWLGFVFWDRVRVELLTAPTPAGWLTAANETGWLVAAPPSDEELRERYERGRSPRRARPSRRAKSNTTGRGAAVES